jgi:hypothetical protein
VKLLLITLLLSASAFSQEPIPKRLLSGVVHEQLKTREQEDRSAKKLQAVIEFCKGHDQVVSPAPDGIVLASKCVPKPAPKAQVEPPKAEEKK